MKALMLVAPGQLEYMDVPDPKIVNPDDVLVRVRAASICGSDTHGYTGYGGRRVPPLIMGHEASGEVVAVGPAVKNVSPGDRIFIKPGPTCGKCRDCLNGAIDACRQRRVYGADLPGAFAEYILISSSTAVPIPDTLSFVHAALIEPLSVVIKGVSRAHIAAGDAVAVVGAGPIGLLATAVTALYHPRQLFVIEPHEGRRILAGEIGGTCLLDPAAGPVWEEVVRQTDDSGVDCAVEAAGTSASVATAVNVTRANGALVWLGNAGRVVEIDEFKVVWNQLTIHASLGVTGSAIERAIQLMTDGAVPVQKLVTLTAPLSEGVEAFVRTATDNSIIKTVLLP